MKVMLELEGNDIKKILNFVCDYLIENEGAIEKFETLLDELKSSAEEAKEDDAILNQIKSFVRDRPLGDLEDGTSKPMNALITMNSVIHNKGHITVWEFVEYLEGRAAADSLEGSYELLNNYGWNRPLKFASDIVVKDRKIIIDPDTIVRLN